MGLSVIILSYRKHLNCGNAFVFFSWYFTRRKKMRSTTLNTTPPTEAFLGSSFFPPSPKNARVRGYTHGVTLFFHLAG